MHFLRKFLDDLRFRWTSFHYNYCWSSYVWLLDGWLPKCSVAIPVVGYAILFNDDAARYLSFDSLAGESKSSFGISSSARLKLLYLGLVFMASGNLLYLWLRPYLHKIGSDLWVFEEKALQNFLVNHYIEIHGTIRHEGHATMYGKYYDAEYDAFLDLAIGPDRGNLRGREASSGDWNAAKRKHEDLLRGMLRDHFFRHDTRKRGRLTFCLIVSVAGYVMFLLPSADLFLKVCRVVILGFL